MAISGTNFNCNHNDEFSNVFNLNPGQKVDGQKVDGQNVDGQKVDGQKVDGQNVEKCTGDKRSMCISMFIRVYTYEYT